MSSTLAEALTKNLTKVTKAFTKAASDQSLNVGWLSCALKRNEKNESLSKRPRGK
jgi:hypothetical protein